VRFVTLVLLLVCQCFGDDRPESLARMVQRSKQKGFPFAEISVHENLAVGMVDTGCDFCVLDEAFFQSLDGAGTAYRIESTAIPGHRIGGRRSSPIMT